MKAFLDDDFLLRGETARTLYHRYAEGVGIFDFHNHLSAQELYEDKGLGNLAHAWLDHDHYKWRAMRAFGVPEGLITGHLNADGSLKADGARDDYARYLAFVRTLQGCVGNPLSQWSHLELRRYFGIEDAVTKENAPAVWDACNALLVKEDYRPRRLLEKMNVQELCTTDDPLDELSWHKKLAADWKNVRVRPSFRPDIPLKPESEAFPLYITRLQDMAGGQFTGISDMIAALAMRMDLFKENAALSSDQSLEGDFYLPADEEEANAIFNRAWLGRKLSHDECPKYRGYMLIELGKLYARKGLAMQMHIGALRDNNKALSATAGKDIGTDSMQDFAFAPQLTAVLSKIYEAEPEAHIILYNLNPKDNEAVATMAANFRNCQFGPAWWFNDHKDGIEEQLRVYARSSVLGKHLGMLTDSRSILSFPRHEYFRRILCTFIGTVVDDGEFPWNEKQLGKMVQDICYSNAMHFFTWRKQI